METQTQSGFSRKIKRFIRYLKNNKWEVALYVVCFVLVVGIALYLFNYFRIITLGNKNEELKNQIAILKSDVSKITSTTNYQRYSHSQYVENKFQTIYWLDTIQSLIGIFDNLKSLGTVSNQLQLTDFKIDMSTIKISGKVNNMKSVYQTGGILDRFTQFDFIENLSIPSYTKNTDGYEFVLDAKIKLNDTKSTPKK